MILGLGEKTSTFKQTFHYIQNKQIGHVARPVRDQKQAIVLSLEERFLIFSLVI